jgi:lysophospholipid acyltransferase (LPLAT)-like uncharacterized protein
VAGLTAAGKDAMRIRDQRLIAAAGWLGTRLVRALSASLRFEYRSLGRFPVDPLQPPETGPFIYALWHENFLIPIARFGNPGVAALVSRHRDGELLSLLIHKTGMGVVRGSTNRGGVTAVRELLRDDVAARHLAVTPDGPRGPRRVVQPGVVYLASRTGMRIVPIGVGHCRPWRARSWDSFAIPRPFSRARCLFGEPLIVPPDLSLNGLAPHVARLQRELDRLTLAAERWADNGRLDQPPALPPSRVVQHPPRVLEVAGVARGDRD